MATKISGLGSATNIGASDLIQVVDVNDTTMAVTGTNKKATAQVVGNNLPVVSTGSTTSRKLKDRFADTVNVKDFGAAGDGIQDDTAAFQAAASAAGIKNPIFVPSGRYLKSAIDNEAAYFWICNNALDAAGVNPISLLGHVEQAFENRKLVSKTTSTPNEYAELQLNKIFNYSGGTAGNVCSTQVVNTSVSSGVTNFVWGITSILNNSANGGQNVAIYGQGNRIANIGPVWGGVFEARDKTNTDGTGKNGTVGIEVDVFANGSDPLGNRIGVDVVSGKGVDAGTTCRATTGVRVGAVYNDISSGTWDIGFYSTAAVSQDFLAQSSSFSAFQATGTNTYGVVLNGTHQIGFDTSTANITSKAIRIAAGQQIALDATGTITMEYSSTSNAILFKNNGVIKNTFSMV
jgi:hypothetical protein